MLGLGWSEMVLIGIVALIVIGPKDLPGLFRTMGEFTGKARVMAREFSRAMEDAAKESGVNDISASLRAAANPQKFGVDKLRQATGLTQKPGPETAKLSDERQAAKDKIMSATAKAATDRQAREVAATMRGVGTTTATTTTAKTTKAPAAKPKSATKVAKAKVESIDAKVKAAPLAKPRATKKAATAKPAATLKPAKTTKPAKAAKAAAKPNGDA